jgi:hypothetical protein
MEILTTAAEGGYCDWIIKLIITERDPEGWIIRATAVYYDENDEKQTSVIGTRVIKRGYQKIMELEFDIDPTIRAQVANNDHDAISADCVIQAGLFGKLVFG